MIGTAIKVTIHNLHDKENMKMRDPSNMVVFRARTLTYKERVLDMV